MERNISSTAARISEVRLANILLSASHRVHTTKVDVSMTEVHMAITEHMVDVDKGCAAATDTAHHQVINSLFEMLEQAV